MNVCHESLVLEAELEAETLERSEEVGEKNAERGTKNEPKRQRGNEEEATSETGDPRRSSTLSQARRTLETGESELNAHAPQGSFTDLSRDSGRETCARLTYGRRRFSGLASKPVRQQARRERR